MPGQGTKIWHAVRRSQKIKKKRKVIKALKELPSYSLGTMDIVPYNVQTSGGVEEGEDG